MRDSTFRFGSGIHRLLYRASGGILLSRAYGISILLLTVTGRKTEKKRTVPLLYFDNGDNIVVVASKGGSPNHPEWYLNSVSNPEVTIQIRRKRIEMQAVTATPDERAKLWPHIVKMYNGYERYQRKTKREIPLVILSRRTGMA